MNKQIELNKETKIIFVLNIFILLLTLFLRNIYNKLAYYSLLINIFFVLNIILLLLCIFINIITFKKDKKLSNKKYLIIVISIFVFFILLNTLIINIINKPINNDYSKTFNKLSEYCNYYSCEKYNTKYDGVNRIFTLEKHYFDYDKNLNLININTFYNRDKVYKIEASIYINNDMFSEEMIKNELQGYFDNFKIVLDNAKIKKAFDNRFNEYEENSDNTYKVTEIYNNNKLTKLRCDIIYVLD